jgi:hypothetical protein
VSKGPKQWPLGYELQPRTAARRMFDRLMFGVFSLALGLMLILLVGYVFLQLSFHGH